MRNPFESPRFDKLKRIFGADAKKEKSKEEEPAERELGPEEIKQCIEDAIKCAAGLRIMVKEGIFGLEDPTADTRKAEKLRDKLAGLMEGCEEAEGLVDFLQSEEIVEITEKDSTK